MDKIDEKYAIPITRKDIIIAPRLKPIEEAIVIAKERTTGILQIHMDLIGLFDLLTELDNVIEQEVKKRLRKAQKDGRL